MPGESTAGGVAKSAAGGGASFPFIKFPRPRPNASLDTRTNESHGTLAEFIKKESTQRDELFTTVPQLFTIWTLVHRFIMKAEDSLKFRLKNARPETC